MVESTLYRGESNFEKVEDGSFYDFELVVGGTILTLIVEHFENYGFMRVELERQENVFQEYV